MTIKSKPTRKESLKTAVQMEEPSRKEITFSHSILCQCFLPEKPLPAGTTSYTARHGDVAVLIEAGKIYVGDDSDGSEIWEQMDVPSGPYARLVIGHASNHVMKHKNAHSIEDARTIPMSSDRTSYLSKYTGTRSTSELEKLSAQVKNISVMKMRLGVLAGKNKQPITKNLPDFAEEVSWWTDGRDPNQRSLWTPYMKLSPQIVQDIWNHGVPLDLRAIMGMHKNQTAQSIYMWLSYRLRTASERGTLIPFFGGENALRNIFKADIKEDRKWQQSFIKALDEALSWYPDAQVSKQLKQKPKGIWIYKSSAPVPENVEFLTHDRSVLDVLAENRRAEKAEEQNIRRRKQVDQEG